jgi:rod shape-determining protein MreD
MPAPRPTFRRRRAPNEGRSLMVLVGRRTPFTEPPGAFERQLVPVVTVLLGSLAVLLPVITTVPVMPSLGLLMLLGWRLPRPGLWPAWAGLPLGLFDDLFSGQPIGSSMALWTMTLLWIDYADIRFVWRGYWQDWSLAAVAFAGVTIGNWALVQFSGGVTPVILLLPPILFGAMLYPVVARACAALDRWRFAR